MKFREALHTSPAFSEQDRASLVVDYDLVTKQAGAGMDFVKKVGPDVLTMLTLSSIAGMFGYAAAKSKYDAHREGLQQSYASLSNQAPFSKNPEQFHTRFHELAVVSPTLAANPQLASKVIEPRMAKGFNLDDVHRLSSIEYHKAHTPGTNSPSAMGLSSGLGRFQQSLEVYGPSMVEQGLKASRDIFARKPPPPVRPRETDEERMNRILNSHMAKMNPNPSFGKESSVREPELRVSEQCLGRMLADTHVMCKTAAMYPGWKPAAGAMGSIGGAVKGALEFFKPSKDTMKEYFHAMAIPLAIGGGIALVNRLTKQKENASLKAQADSVYRGLQGSSDAVKENPEMAFEAFDSLRSFAPSLAAKPLIAKTFVEHVIATDGRGMGPEAAQQLANTESIVKKLNENSGGGFITGLKEPMTLFGYKIGKPPKKEK